MTRKDKFTPLPAKEYIVTDQCFWKPMTDKERSAYNPYDKDRLPHAIQLVDAATGTMVNLPSGSVIKVVRLAQS